MAFTLSLYRCSDSSVLPADAASPKEEYGDWVGRINLDFKIFNEDWPKKLIHNWQELDENTLAYIKITQQNCDFIIGMAVGVLRHSPYKLFGIIE